MQSSFRAFPFVFFTRSVTEPAPQNSITSYGPRDVQGVGGKQPSGRASFPASPLEEGQRPWGHNWGEPRSRGELRRGEGCAGGKTGHVGLRETVWVPRRSPRNPGDCRQNEVCAHGFLGEGPEAFVGALWGPTARSHNGSPRVRAGKLWPVS